MSNGTFSRTKSRQLWVLVGDNPTQIEIARKSTLSERCLYSLAAAKPLNSKYHDSDTSFIKTSSLFLHPASHKRNGRNIAVKEESFQMKPWQCAHQC